MDNVKKVPQRDGYGLGLLELCKTRLPEGMGIPAAEIQVLTPTHRGAAGGGAS